MITPTVGRVVWVRNRAGSIDTRQPETANVVYVHSPGCINVRGWDANGNPFTLTSLMLKQDDPALDTWMETYQGPYAEWMPYQKGQAEKTEALERAASSGT